MPTRASLLAIPVGLALLVAGIGQASPAAATAPPVVPGALATYASTPTSGALTQTAPFQSIGGTSGQALTAGVAKTVKLAKTPGVTSTVTELMVQIVVLKAPAAGTIIIAPGGQPATASPLISYSAGTSSITTMVTTNGSHALTVAATSSIHFTLSVIGTITGSSTSATGPGGTKLVPSTGVVAQSTGLGGAVPSVGNPAEVPIAGIAGIPSHDVRAVWLSVQALGSGAGAISFASDPLDPVAAGVAPTAAGRWTTSLVLAPVDDNGAFVYSQSGAATTDLRMSVVGWVAETTSGQSAISISGGVQTIDSPSLTAHRISTRTGISYSYVDVPPAAVPSRAYSVIIRATITTGTKSGHLREGSSLAASKSSKAIGIAVSAHAATQVVLSARISTARRLYVALPSTATLSLIAVVGVQMRAVSSSRDTTGPTLEIDSPTAGQVVGDDDSPTFTVSGRSDDTTSGIRRLSIWVSGQLVGTASPQTQRGSTAWSLVTSAPAGSQTITVEATNWASRVTSRSVTFTVDAPSPTATIVDPSTRVLSNAEVDSVSSVTADSLVFSAQPEDTPLAGRLASVLGAREQPAASSPSPIINPFYVGQILVKGVTAKTPDGLLRRVTAVQTIGGNTTVSTVPAALTEVLKQASVSFAGVPLQGQGTVSDGSTSVLPVTKTFDTGQLAIAPAVTGEVVAAISTKLDVDIDIRLVPHWGLPTPQLQAFKTAFDATSSVTATVAAGGSITLAKASKTFDAIPVGNFTFFMGAVPVVITTSLEPTASLSASVGGQVGLSYQATYSSESGVQYQNGQWSPVNTHSTTSELKPIAHVDASLTASVGVEFAAKLYNIAGPYVELSAGLSLTAGADAVAQATTLSLDFEIQGSVGVKIEVLDQTLADWNQPLLDIKANILSWTDDWTTEPPPGPPGPGIATSWLHRPNPVRTLVPGLTNITSLAAGFGTQLAVESDGSLWGWGDVGEGLLGPDAPVKSAINEPILTTPIRIPGLPAIKQAAMNTGASYALDTTGHVWMWGLIDLGTGSSQEVATPMEVTGLDDVASISANGQVVIALKSDGTVWMWGKSLTNEPPATLPVPTQVAGLDHITSVSAGYNAGYALRDDGTVWAWGNEGSGELGDGDFDRFTGTPVQVVGLTDVKLIAGGTDAAFAVTNDGSVWGWGRGGSLGIGATANVPVATKIDGISGVTAISSGVGPAIAIAANGQVWSWDAASGNEDGPPIAVPGLTDATAVVSDVTGNFAVG